MRTIHRDIASGFIFSKDGKLLLGLNRKGGVYEGYYVVPGGGIEEGESKLDALKREMLEETGIDISKATVSKFFIADGEHEKTLHETGERVNVKMKFYNFRVDLPQKSSEAILHADDDWIEPRWFTMQELQAVKLSPPTKLSLVKNGLLPE